MLTLADVKLILDDLYEKRHAALVKSHQGKFADPELAELRTQIERLPRALTTATPLADEIAVADDEHDEAGRVLYLRRRASSTTRGLPRMRWRRRSTSAPSSSRSSTS